MIHRIYIFLFCLSLLFTSVTLYGLFGVHSNIQTDEAKEMEKAIIAEFLKPNRFGYLLIDSAPHNLHGMTYYTDLRVKVHGYKFTNKEDVINLYVLIYKDILKRINELRGLRPFFAHFPLTPHNMALKLNSPFATILSLTFVSALMIPASLVIFTGVASIFNVSPGTTG